MRPLKLMMDQVDGEMRLVIQSGGEIVVGMTRNPAKTRRLKPPLHPRQHRRLRMGCHLRVRSSDLSVRCQPASFDPPCLTVLKNE